MADVLSPAEVAQAAARLAGRIRRVSVSQLNPDVLLVHE